MDIFNQNFIFPRRYVYIFSPVNREHNCEVILYCSVISAK